jgi:3-isopropylmalate/(R)-2-methylmalate dehydratase small subunit
MAEFTTLTSRIIPLPIDNVDTDQIIPARFLKVTDKAGLGAVLFCDWRYEDEVENVAAAAGATPKPSFPINDERYQGAQILLAGDNFGCGSSREHAPWALTGWGIRAVIATSFADIFRSNALKNGLLPIVVDADTHADLVDLTEETTEAELTVDLASQTLTLPGGRTVSFPIDPFAKSCLLRGVDQLGYLLSFADAVEAYEEEREHVAASSG